MGENIHLKYRNECYIEGWWNWCEIGENGTTRGTQAERDSRTFAGCCWSHWRHLDGQQRRRLRGLWRRSGLWVPRVVNIHMGGDKTMPRHPVHGGGPVTLSPLNFARSPSFFSRVHSGRSRYRPWGAPLRSTTVPSLAWGVTMSETWPF